MTDHQFLATIIVLIFIAGLLSRIYFTLLDISASLDQGKRIRAIEEKLGELKRRMEDDDGESWKRL